MRQDERPKSNTPSPSRKRHAWLSVKLHLSDPTNVAESLSFSFFKRKGVVASDTAVPCKRLRIIATCSLPGNTRGIAAREKRHKIQTFLRAPRRYGTMRKSNRESFYDRSRLNARARTLVSRQIRSIGAEVVCKIAFHRVYRREHLPRAFA